jgi:Aminomethyltransferase folate-binding domain
MSASGEFRWPPVGIFSWPPSAGRRYLQERTRESLGRLYAMHWPDLTTARGPRRSPLHDQVAAAGACFGEVAGWERANWYAQRGEHPEYHYSFERPPYFERVALEHEAARTASALFDLSSFAKMEGPGGPRPWRPCRPRSPASSTCPSAISLHDHAHRRAAASTPTSP